MITRSDETVQLLKDPTRIAGRTEDAALRPRAAGVAERQPLHLPRLPRVRAGRSARRDRPRRPSHRARHGAGAGHRPGHPPRGPGRPRGLPCTTAAGHPALSDDHHQGQPQVPDPPARLSGLHRDPYLRRRRPGDRRATLPRAVLLLRLLRERHQGAGPAAEGGRGTGAVGLRRAEPWRQGDHGRAGHLPARRAVPDPDERAGGGRGEGRPPQGAPPGSDVRPPRPLRPLPVLPGLPAAGPLHHRRSPADGGDPDAPARRRIDRLHRAGHRVGAGPAALRPADAGRGGDGRGRRPRPGEGADARHPVVERRVRRPDRATPIIPTSWPPWSARCPRATRRTTPRSRRSRTSPR